MTMPNLDQTEGVWIGRTSDQGYHYVQAVSQETRRVSCGIKRTAAC